MPRKGGSLKQCQKILANGKPEVRSTKVVRCKMPLTPEGTCPIHGYDVN